MEGRTQDEGSTTETTTIVGQDRTPEGALPQGTILEIQANLASKDLFASGCSWIERFGYDHAKLLNRPEILQSLLAHVEPGATPSMLPTSGLHLDACRTGLGVDSNAWPRMPTLINVHQT